tara:strand:- start:506 stop:775 length:270 start_codon:yes stop_codon:yes gene_type:complete
MGNGTEQDHLLDVHIPGYEEKSNLLEQDGISLMFDKAWVRAKIHSTYDAIIKIQNVIVEIQKERDELKEVEKKIQEAIDILNEKKNEQG